VMESTTCYDVHRMEELMVSFEYPWSHRRDAEADAVARTLKRLKHLSILSAHLGTNFDVDEEVRLRRLQKQDRRNSNAAAAAIDHHGLATQQVQREHSTTIIAVKAFRKSISEPLGLGVNAQCIVTHVGRSTSFAHAMSQLGWYPKDCVKGGELQVIRVNHQNVRNVEEFKHALRSSPQSVASAGSSVMTSIVLQRKALRSGVVAGNPSASDFASSAALGVAAAAPDE
jgi:hypothetical protein